MSSTPHSQQVWACLTRSDLDADLRECDDAVADAGNSAAWWQGDAQDIVPSLFYKGLTYS